MPTRGSRRMAPFWERSSSRAEQAGCQAVSVQADDAHGYLFPVAVLDIHPKGLLCLEDAQSVVAQGAMTKTGHLRFRSVEPAVNGEIVLGLAAILAGRGFRVVPGMRQACSFSVPGFCHAALSGNGATAKDITSTAAPDQHDQTGGLITSQDRLVGKNSKPLAGESSVRGSAFNLVRGSAEALDWPGILEGSGEHDIGALPAWRRWHQPLQWA